MPAPLKSPSHLLSLALAAAATLALGCDDGARGPTRPGGSGGSGGPEGPDAALPPADAAGITPLTGRVCAIDDPRAPLACRAEDLAGVDVAARGGGSTTAAADGSFTLEVASPQSTVLEVGFADGRFRDSLVPVGRFGTTTPVVPLSTWQDLMDSLGEIEPDGTATIAVYFVSAGAPASGVNVVAPDGTSAVPYYDALAPQPWDPLGPTGDFGAALLIGVPADAPAAFTVIPAGGQALTVSAVPVAAGATTYLAVAID